MSLDARFSLLTDNRAPYNVCITTIITVVIIIIIIIIADSDVRCCRLNGI